MRNNLTKESIRKNWENLSELVDGELHFGEYERANINAGIITAKINFKYKGVNILIHQGIFQGGRGQFDFNPINIIGIPERKINFNLGIWKLDIFDKLFSPNRMKTGFYDFDKKFAIKGEPKRDLIDFFRDESIRNIFLKNKTIAFNISERNGENQIKLKELNSYGNIENIKYLKKMFMKFVDRLIEIKIITPTYNKSL